MNRQSLILILLIAVIGGAIYFMTRAEDKEMASLKAERDFRLEDPDEVQKMFLVNQNGTKLLFERTDEDNWIVNGKYKANDYTVPGILDVMHNIRIKSVPNPLVSKEALKVMSAFAIKVELYGKQDALIKSFYVGGVNPTETGTYFLMDGYNQPFLMEKKFEQAALRTYFTVSLKDVRDRLIFNENVDDIKYVRIEYPKAFSQSFEILRKGRKKFEVLPLGDVPNMSQDVPYSFVEQYLISFKRVGLESIKNDFPLRDSILQTPMMADVLLVDKQQDSIHARFWTTFTPEVHDGYSALKYGDSRTKYFTQTDDDRFGLIQHLTFGKAFVPYEYFAVEAK